MKTCLLIVHLTISQLCSAAVATSGDADIDRVREVVRNAPTTAENYRERSLLMFLWLAALQQQGADTHPFFDIDKTILSTRERGARPAGRGA